MAWQGDAKTGAALLLKITWTVHMDFAMLLFYDREHQCKTQTGSLTWIFGGEKRLK